MKKGAVDNEYHQPVLIKSLIEKLPPVNGLWIDCTFGAGGYSKALLEAGADRIVAIDRDPSVIFHARELGAKYGSKLDFCEANFSSLMDIVVKFKIKKISGIVFDVGVSSMQIDEANRGFSFQQDGPLDMRMSQKGITAADIVNNALEEELANVIFYYGEDRQARMIARAIVKERSHRKILTTEHLSDIIKSVVKPSKSNVKKTLNPATRTFQALRIAVNNELEELNTGLISAEQILEEGALLAVVSFHSLEDRLVKQFIKSRSKRSSGKSRYLPADFKFHPTFRELFNKVVKPNVDEISKNSRARSAKLRIAERLNSRPSHEGVSKIQFPRVKFSTGLR